MSSIPALSIVVTARNDDHGGNLLSRMQLFVTGLLEQAKRHRLSCELIIVEWNPPQDKPKLSEALNWPREPGPCSVRIIEVPPHLHRRFRYSSKLPLYQMIAKNVGIRRARGRFVVATNIDLLFSDALIKFFASGKLNPQFMYRIDRYDVPSDIPLKVSIAERLDYCKRHVIRVNRRDGTFSSEVLRRIVLMKLGFLVTNFGEYAVRFLPHLPRIERPGLPHFRTRHRSRRLKSLVGGYINSRGMLLLDGARFIRRYVRPQYLRTLNNDPLLKARFLLVRLRENLPLFLPHLPQVTIRCRIRLLLPDLRRFINTRRRLVAEARTVARKYFRPPYPRLHTNGCGDFTLMAREHWFALRGYPELDMFSFNLDSVLCHMAFHNGVREKVLRDPMRIYHIEHASGWTPKGEQLMIERLRNVGIPMLEFPQFESWAIRMTKEKRPIIFNSEGWGFTSENLSETRIWHD